MSKELIKMLNGALARELSVSIQYMWHHVTGKGMESPGARKIFRDIAMVEMKHAEVVAERIDYLGGEPTTQPAHIKFGGDLGQMIKDNLESEQEAIAFYKMIVSKASEENDIVTRRLFEEIISAEEEHEAEFATLLGVETSEQIKAEAA